MNPELMNILNGCFLVEYNTKPVMSRRNIFYNYIIRLSSKQHTSIKAFL